MLCVLSRLPTCTSGRMPSDRADAHVKRVLSAVGIYDALGLDPSKSLRELHKVYRKVCLQLHPDKCHHPKATEAFQQLAAFMEKLEKLVELTGSPGGGGTARDDPGGHRHDEG